MEFPQLTNELPVIGIELSKKQAEDILDNILYFRRKEHLPLGAAIYEMYHLPLYKAINLVRIVDDSKDSFQ